MKHYLRGSVVAAFLLGAAAAHADSAKTLGGIVVTSDDGNFVASLGGRIQFDYTGILPDKGSGIDSGAAENDSGFYFRRVFISLAGKVYGWRYRIDEDLANTTQPGRMASRTCSYPTTSPSTPPCASARPSPGAASTSWPATSTLLSSSATPTPPTASMAAASTPTACLYRYSRPNILLPHDHFWGGASVYSLNSAGSTTNEGTGTPTQGLGYNARLTYQPIIADREWLHVGASYSNEHADNGASLTAADSVWYSYKGVTQTLASLSGLPVLAVSGSASALANINGGNNPADTIIQGELAGAYGPLYLQGELGLVRAEPADSAAPRAFRRCAERRACHSPARRRTS